MASEVPPLFESYYGREPRAVRSGRAVSLNLFVEGHPEPKHRHRSRVVQTKGKPFVQHYNDPRTTAWEDDVATQVKDAIIQLPLEHTEQDFVLPFKGRLLVTLRFNLAKPKSYPKTVVHHTKKPDVDNLAKSVLDALQKAGVIDNDNLVTDLTVSKRYAELTHPEGVELDLTALPD